MVGVIPARKTLSDSFLVAAQQPVNNGRVPTPSARHQNFHNLRIAEKAAAWDQFIQEQRSSASNYQIKVPSNTAYKGIRSEPTMSRSNSVMSQGSSALDYDSESSKSSFVSARSRSSSLSSVSASDTEGSLSDFSGIAELSRSSRSSQASHRSRVSGHSQSRSSRRSHGHHCCGHSHHSNSGYDSEASSLSSGSFRTMEATPQPKAHKHHKSSHARRRRAHHVDGDYRSLIKERNRVEKRVRTLKDNMRIDKENRNDKTKLWKERGGYLGGAGGAAAAIGICMSSGFGIPLVIGAGIVGFVVGRYFGKTFAGLAHRVASYHSYAANKAPKKLELENLEARLKQIKNQINFHHDDLDFIYS